jgi:outer membrane lipoprotein carrier protein
MDTSKKIFSLFFLLFTFSLFATEKTDKIFDKLVNKYDSIKTFQADFVQTNYWKEIDETLVSRGKIYYNSKKLLLDYIKPKPQKMLLDTTSLIIWDIKENQAIITNNNTDISRPIDIIKKFWQNSKIIILEEKKNFIKLKLVSDEQIIIVELKNYIIKKMKIINRNGNFVEYSFKNIKINKVIKNKLFDIKLPDDVNIIRNN